MARKPMVGIAYRPAFRVELFNAPSRVDYIEITADDYLDLRGRVRDDLDALRSTFTIVVHAVGLSIGSADGIDRRYLEGLARVIEFVHAPWWSDHLAFTRAGGRRIGHFAPLRRDRASVECVARNAAVVRQTIAAPFALENPARPFDVPGSTLGEGAFLSSVADAAGCGILLDVENLHANERNFDEPAEAVIAALAPDRIAEVHVAGGRFDGRTYIDSHDAPVPERTWSLLGRLLARANAPAVTLERDAGLTSLRDLGSELDRIGAR